MNANQLQTLRQAILANRRNLAQVQAATLDRQATNSEAMRIAKERRFTLSATMLAEKPIKVSMINDERAPLAAMDIHTNQLMLNEGDKRLDFRNPVKALINLRASLFHEVDHSLFTKDPSGKVKALSEKSKNPSHFHLLRNILEDGRIERLGRQQFLGSGDFLDASLLEIAKKLSASPFDGLHIYVRTGMFRNAKEEKFWRPYKARIDAAVNGDSTSKMLDEAYAIVEAMNDSNKQGEQGDEQGEGEPQNGAGEPQGGEQGEGSGEDESDASDESSAGEGEGEGEDDDDEGANGEGDEGDDEGGEQGAGDSDSDESGEGDSNSNSQGDSEDDNEQGEGEGKGNGEGASDEDDASDDDESEEQQGGKGSGGSDNKPAQLDDKTFRKLSEIVAEAMRRCKAEAQSDYDAIVAEAEAYEPEQGYISEPEQGASDELAATFTSLLVESARTSYYSSRCGLLNQAALANALTSRKCFHKREDTPQTPHVALLLDVSYSMVERAAALTSAARVINGALRKAKIDALVVTFGGEQDDDEAQCVTRYKTIPSDETLCIHGSTPTDKAMKVANDWLENEGATRGLVIVVTDGMPNDADAAQAQLQRAEQSGAYVIGVLVGIKPSHYGNAQRVAKLMTAQFHEHAFCENVSDLPNVLAPMLATYIAQS